MTENLPATTESNTLEEKPARPELKAKPVDKKPIIIAVAIFAIITLIFIGLCWYLFTHPQVAATLSHVSIFFVSLLMVVIAVLLMVLVLALVYVALKINDLTQLLNREVQPLLQRAQDVALTADTTAKTVQSRVTVVSDEAVKPIITLIGYASGAKAIFNTLFKRD